MANYLLEIGMEEIPARFLSSIQSQFKDLMGNFLQEQRLNFDHIESFATPRRIAVRVIGLADKQEDVQELAKGPSLKIAQDAEGNWTKAALGFLKGQGATVEDITIDDVKGESYIFVNKFIPGQTRSDILKDLPSVLGKFNFPVSMRWNQLEQSFIRPIHWMVSLLNDQLVPMTFLNVEAGTMSQGHRFLGQAVELTHADTYVETLKNEKVMVDFAQRQATIREQIEAIATQQGWNVPIDQDLLDEVTAIVEWPTAFYGEFDSKYLDIPAIISVTAMRDHQRYFYVQDAHSQEILPYFISVRNGDSHAIDNVIKGNLKVLTARLEDALFFYQEDLKQPMEHYIDKLHHVKEHFKLSNLFEKQERVQQVMALMAEVFPSLTKAELTTAQTAASMYKFDLMTNTVGEFSELQGQIGEILALEYGQDAEVAQAIGSQYLPTSAGGDLPQTHAGAMLAFADKFDTVAQYFSIDMIPTGSNDPYALRRQTMGLVEIIHDNQWDGDLQKLMAMYEQTFGIASIQENMTDFIKARVNQFLSQSAIDYDIIESSLDVTQLNVLEMIRTAKTLQTFKNTDTQQYRLVMEAVSRIVNLGKDQSDFGELDMVLAQSDSERAMLTWTKDLHVNNVDALLQAFNHQLAMIETYFENNMVNAQESDIRANRLLTMGKLSTIITTYFNPQKLVTK